jgi:intracellular sulfur oxidation DsrE/DsrF family protein
MSDQLHRRSFLGRLSGGAIAFLAAARTSDASPRVRAVISGSPDEWLKNLSGKHRQVFDATSPNDAFPMGFAKNFLDSTEKAEGLTDKDLGVVVVLRHAAIPWALQDRIWAKYKLGEAPFNITDAATKQPSVRNTFARGSGNFVGWGVEELMARGVVFGVCNLALGFYSGMQAGKVGVSADVAKQEWTAGVIPGVTIIPSGVWGVNNAQEHGCSYCYAG